MWRNLTTTGRACLLVGLLAACAKSRSPAGAVSPTDNQRDSATDGSDAKPPDVGTASAEPICDGSATMRLGYSSGGGFVATTYSFTNPYGNMYLFVDGHCRYYASVDYMQGVATGTLTEVEAEQLALDVGWRQVEAWSSYRDEQCPDAGSSSITRSGFAATCICACKDKGPSGLADAMQAAFTWTRKLVAFGARATGAMSAGAIQQIRPSGHELAWSLGRPVASIGGFVQESQIGVDTPARFDAPDEVASLRTLRSDAVAAMQYAQFLPVLDNGVAYFVYARDELPEDVPKAIDALLKSVPVAN